MIIALVIGLTTAALAAGLSASIARKNAQRDHQDRLAQAHAAAQAVVASAKTQAHAESRSAQALVLSDSLALRSAALAELSSVATSLDQREASVHSADQELAATLDTLEQRQRNLDEASREIQSLRDRATGLERDTDKRIVGVAHVLEQRASVSAKALIDDMTSRWLQDAQARAAAQIRAIEQTAADPAYDRQAKRLMEIAGPRYQHHYLTERNVANLRCGTDIVTVLVDNDRAVLRALEQVSGITLQVSDDRDAIRMEGIDGVGREMIRRAFSRLERKREAGDEARKAPEEWAKKAQEAVHQEITALGKKAFATLHVQKAHPEIVGLVGALNFRTSYTQNQWWHAVEAAYLAGMIAAEMGIDEKMARRSTLMHDIGKALTHKIDGSHAVIGAEIARRLGEPEIVANAIGSHHNDEPQNSVYAYLTAAADAMSGARPGARREATEGFSTKVEDLERIGFERRGVSHAHAVHGGRELRVYVRERDVDDATVVEMSGEIASQISEEMTFPGQIKVTVIRSFEAVATAN